MLESSLETSKSFFDGFSDFFCGLSPFFPDGFSDLFSVPFFDGFSDLFSAPFSESLPGTSLIGFL
ncbi:hypothetical protein CWATWH0005_5344 [Crocosphaera watsonii WH 0005]|uniref:Uncharacterized protein n=1 Tax=Crocosphaera watsonii WH 0005 TaxID=423472 RepID=T2IQP1_CROWT|nr:hypothetical protein CWATWH0005_5344 [Crocosphaera watsonii WH 0005]